MHEHYTEAYKLIRNAIKRSDLSDVISLLRNDEALFHLDTPFGTWLHMAAAHGTLEIVKWLIEHGADVNARAATIESRPLDEAASNGHPEIVKYLIDSGATLDVSDSVRNPLFGAIVGGMSDAHTEVAKILIDSCIDTTIRYPNLSNMDALEYAKEWGRDSIVKLLNHNQREH